MSKNKYYGIADVNGELRPVCFAEFEWKDTPFDGIEVTDEPFNINNYNDYILKDGKWIHQPLPKDFSGVIIACIMFFMFLFPSMAIGQNTSLKLGITQQLYPSSQEKELDYHDSPLFKFRSWQDEKQFLWTSGLLIANGACKAQADILRDNYWYFKQVFPSANDKNWNPAISFQNKGPGFLNRTVFVWTSDWWHRFDTGHNLTLYVICVIPLAHINETLRLPARVIIARGLWDVGMRSVGYNSVDRLLYHHY